VIALTSKFPWIKKLSPTEELSLIWSEITNYEKELSAMSVQQLAAALHEANIKNDTENRIIVEHMLKLRLAYVQSKASWGSGWLSFSGSLFGAALAFYLGLLSSNELQKSPPQVCSCQCVKDVQCIDAIPKPQPSSEVVQPVKPIKINPHKVNGHNKQQNGTPSPNS